MTSRGVIYMCWGAQAIQQAKESIESLHLYYADLDVVVVGDDNTLLAFEGTNIHVIKIDVEPFNYGSSPGHKFMAGRIKPLLASVSPFDETLYVDADTVFKSSPKCGFDMLDRWDFVVAETETRSLASTIAGVSESNYTAKWVKTPHLLYHNSGMIFWRKNDATKRLFELWSKEWLRFENWDEQVALLRALLRSDAVFQTVPYVWNCRNRREAFMLHHWFGTGHARTSGNSGSKLHFSNRQRNGNVSTQMVIVEVAPGRTVKCYAGDEQRVMDHYKQIKGRRSHE